MRRDLEENLETWRLIVLRRDGSEFLAMVPDSGLLLPSVQIPAHSRTAQSLNARLHARWNLEVYCLYPIHLKSAQATIRYHVVETLHRDAKAPCAAHWISVRDVCRTRFAEDSDFAAVQKSIETFAGDAASTIHTPFQNPGWFFPLKNFIQDAVRNIPLRLNGQFVQYNASSSFSLIRFDTDGDAAWFKAVGEPNVREFELTVLLSARLSEFVPRVLTTEPAWNAWTMLDAGGIPLSRANDTAAWCLAVRDLARMQIASIVVTDELLACHARDVRVQALLGQLKPFFQVMNELMDRQPAGTPRALSAAELRELEIDIREALLDLLSESAPDTIGHLDLNPDNIMVDSDGAVFLDWAEGAVGHPFLSLSYLLEFSSRSFEAEIEANSLLIRSYAREWEAAGLALDFGPTLTTCTLLAIFAHAVSTDLWRDDQHLQHPGVAGYYRSLTRRMKKYRDRIRNGIYDITGVLG